MPAPIMSELFMCICFMASISKNDAHSALEWAVQEGHIREDGFIKTPIPKFGYSLAQQFNTVFRNDLTYKKENGHYCVYDKENNKVFDPQNRFAEPNSAFPSYKCRLWKHPAWMKKRYCARYVREDEKVAPNGKPKQYVCYRWANINNKDVCIRYKPFEEA
ncbi:hypothetical protein TVAG_088440 [Trichomonas vaginalis G3]|uniref:Uncharacterized protein n=1 Tax=Trichomonas vaginalis (strain ATCC PRA-98 / G3) TaxID=412133 RepID=A2EAY9_TRIV3|nr:hypothetical protein TVAGG3_0398240 [Trichomonas vaginalis G3]EAY10129.1 hypothetical protein TVAG_088440 [Trichomonas vaginalis G3]KAI5534495.1 hypothetical protein TVAGG3_0398240 [Trichomonas vaginalis G3]|eukprot:XP_001322352.1 hypothetical protein [Trichomonas vaginalis G3]